MRKLLVGFSALFMSIVVFGQKPFQGKISYDIAYQEFPEGKEAMEHVLPHEATWIISGQDTRIESKTEVGGETTSIYMSDDDSVTVLFELTDRAVYLRRPRKGAVKFRVIPKRETKSWNGIELTKHVLQSADGLVIEAWCDIRFQNTAANGYADLKFLPLIFELEDRGVLMKYTANKVVTYPIDETYFKIPEDRVRVSSRTLQKIVK